MDFFTPTEKAEFSSLFDDLHETFSREVVAFKEPEVTRIISDPDQVLAFYPDAQPNTEVEYTPVSTTLKARIRYMTEQELIKYVNDGKIATDSTQVRADLSLGLVRIRVNEAGRDYLLETQRLILDGNNFERYSDPRPHGLFSPQYWDFYFRRLP